MKAILKYPLIIILLGTVGMSALVFSAAFLIQSLAGIPAGIIVFCVGRILICNGSKKNLKGDEYEPIRGNVRNTYTQGPSYFQ